LEDQTFGARVVKYNGNLVHSVAMFSSGDLNIEDYDGSSRRGHGGVASFTSRTTAHAHHSHHQHEGAQGQRSERHGARLAPQFGAPSFVRFAVRGEFVGIHGFAQIKPRSQHDEVRSDQGSNGGRHFEDNNGEEELVA